MEDLIETDVIYAAKSQLQSFKAATSGGNLTVNLITSAGIASTTSTINTGIDPIRDWYDQQILSLTNTAIYWNSIAPKPRTSQYAANRNGKSDEIHVVIVEAGNSSIWWAIAGLLI